MKNLLRISTVAYLGFLLFGCTNGKYDTEKSDRIASHVGEYTGATPTTQPVPIVVKSVADQTPYGSAIFGLINASILLVHEFNAKQRAKVAVGTAKSAAELAASAASDARKAVSESKGIL